MRRLKDILRKIVMGLALVLLLCSLVSCAGTEYEPAQKIDGNMPAMLSMSFAGDIEEKMKAEQIEDWKWAYLDTFEYADECTYSLIYVDDDTIPELVVQMSSCAGGIFILTYHDGLVDEVQIYRLDFSYIERGNLVCNSLGSMGAYYDYVYMIQDGYWKQIGCGEYFERLPDPEKGIAFHFAYWWDGEEVTEEAYHQNLYDIYQKENSKEAEDYYILDEICSILRRGEVTSADHHYELIMGDMTWSQARERCMEKGGYLAAITSWDEFERIQEQIIAEEKTDAAFWIGAVCWRKDL